MAYGTELALGIDFDRARPILTREGIVDVAGIETRDGWEDALDAANQKLAGRLLEVHRQVLADRFGHAEVTAANGGSPLIVTTVDGRRQEVWPFQFGYVGDVGEFGHSWPQMYRVGVSLVTRYWPTWLDVHHRHGGSGLPVILDAATMQLVDQARDALATVIPELADGVLVVSPQWY